MCWLRNSCIVYKGKTKDCAGSLTFQHKSCRFAPLMLAGLHNQSPLLTMMQVNYFHPLTFGMNVPLFTENFYRVKGLFFNNF